MESGPLLLLINNIKLFIMMQVDTPEQMKELLKRAIETVNHYVDLGNQKFNVKMNYPKVVFDIKGTTAGYACISSNTIRLNPTLLRQNPEKFLGRTPGHEVAHFFCRFIHKDQWDKHGPKWKAIMWALGLDATRCHSFNVDTVPTRVGKVKNQILPPVKVEGGKMFTPRGGVKITTFED